MKAAVFGVVAGIALVGLGGGAAGSSARAQQRPGMRQLAESLADFTYFAVRPDPRRCASPRCGGFFVRRVNRPTTVCADRVSRAECYVAEIDASDLGLGADGEAELRGHVREILLRGEIVAKRFEPGERLGSLQVREALRGHGGQVPSGAFFRVRDAGIRCATFPCPSLSATQLNSLRRPESFAAVDLTGIAPDPGDGLAQLSDPRGLVVAAQRTTSSGPAGSAPALDANEYYLPVAARAQSCGSRGLAPCSPTQFCDFAPGAQCGRADAPGGCAVRPDICTQQFDPVCGCDGETYPSACEAAAAGMSVDFRGECRS